MRPVAPLLLASLVVLPSLAASPKISDEVLQRLAAGERVPVIVALRSGPAIDRSLGRLTAGHGTLRARWQHAPAYAAEIAIDTLPALANDDEVVRVDADRGGSIALAESVPMIGATAAHQRGLRGEGAVVAVIDTGVESSHPDLDGAVIAEQCWCRTAKGAGCCPNRQATQSGSGAAADENGHGTHVSGIIASRGRVAATGVAPAAKLVVARITDASGNWAYTSQMISALDWINRDHPEVRAVNISLGNGVVVRNACDAATADAIAIAAEVAALRRRGTVVVAAAGNDASPDGVTAPACISSIWAVGSVYDANVGGRRYPQAKDCTDFTTRPDLPVCSGNGGPQLAFFAPGSIITSCGLHGTTADLGGTSMAAPHVAAAAALLFAAKPSLSVDALEAILRTTGVPITDPRNGITTPRIDVDRASALLLAPPGPRRRAASH